MRSHSYARTGLALLGVCIFFFVAVVCPAQDVLAETAPGVRVIALRGPAVAVGPDGVERVLAAGDALAVGETVKTGPGGRLQLMFADNTVIGLGVDAEMVIDRFHWDERQGELSTTVNQGAFRVMGGAVARTSPDNFTTETPSATIGIRGSMYAGRVSNGALTVVFQGGAGIWVGNPVGRVEITTPGTGTRVRTRNDPPDEPFPFTDDDLGALEDEDELGEGEEQQPADEDNDWEDSALDEGDADDTTSLDGADIGDDASRTASQDDLTKQTEDQAEESQGEVWRGFVVGSRSYEGVVSNHFYNQEKEDFTLWINRSQGSYHGSFNAVEAFTGSPDYELHELTPAGDFQDEYHMSGEITSGTVVSGSQSDPVIPPGSFSGYGPLAEHVNWGYWSTSYTDESSQTHEISGYWVAGEVTPQAYVQSLISGSFVGEYNGGAQGYKVESGSMVSLNNGQSQLLINFGTGSVGGSILFDETSFTVGGTSAVNSGGFSAQITQVGGIAGSGDVQGAFYGSQANSIGGSFQAVDDGSNSYMGIFGGNR